MPHLQIDGAALEFEWFDRSGQRQEAEAAWTPGDEVDRAPLVFLHEGLGSLTQWRDVPTQLCARTGRSGIAYARPGYGRSQPPAYGRAFAVGTPSWFAARLEREAGVVLPELLRRCGIERSVLVGHSDGASIALIYAAQPDTTVQGVVAIAPHVIVEDCTLDGITAAGAAFRAGPLRDRLARHHDDVDAMFATWHDGWLDAGFRRWDIRAGLPRIDVPVLLVQGERDTYGTTAQLDAIEAGVSGPVRRLQLPGCGHAPHLEDPAAVLDAIVAFAVELP